ncbi:MAG: protein kinase [Myxococcales bacterium]|nr:protein kinase [Myxococcales bacterium]MCB9567623.1 protein kinase [Myxococcales bacterium]MCB9702561.1 protein kinase [Myxococcales bacterium]
MPTCPYRKIRPLGEGAVGDVQLCIDVGRRRLLVVKWLRAELQDGSQAALRFRREAELMAGVSLRGVIKVEEWGVDDLGRTWMAMEFVDGLPPSSVIGPSEGWLVHRFLEGVASSLDELHGVGIVHRDLKPDNVLLRGALDGWEPVIIDLGIAKWLAQDTATATGSVFGTPYYMSPEQFRDSKHVGPATDRYALAVMIFELLAGRRPFEGRSIPDLLRQHLEAPVPPLEIPRRLCTGMLHDDPQAKIYPTPNLDAFMAKAMHKDPRLRYHSGAEMADEFKRAAIGDGLFNSGTIEPLFDPLPRPLAEISIEGRASQRFDLRHGPLVFGRHESCQVVLASSRLSRFHACAYVHRGRLWLADLNSQNGSLLDGHRLTPGLPVPFPRGEQVAKLSLYNREISIRTLRATL